ncbi:MAG: hypothetical protein WC942_07425 [Clostridia bacterium]|jgi:hypothetical protein
MKLPLEAKIEVLAQLTKDYENYAKNESVDLPDTLTYNISCVTEGKIVRQAAREAAFDELKPIPLTKFAFDTRRIDQENTRNPRTNLQYWHRTDQFIDEEDQVKLKTFAKLAKVLNTIKHKMGTAPEWFESYARQLYDNVYRIIRVKEADLDIFRPQLSYLEQLVFARYRLSMENIQKYSEDKLEEKILSKDESLIGRSIYLKETGDDKISLGKKESVDMTKTTQDSIVNAIFGSGSVDLRKDGERTVERTITITIRDNVID